MAILTTKKQVHDPFKSPLAGKSQVAIPQPGTNYGARRGYVAGIPATPQAPKHVDNYENAKKNLRTLESFAPKATVMVKPQITKKEYLNMHEVGIVQGAGSRPPDQALLNFLDIVISHSNPATDKPKTSQRQAVTRVA